MNTQKRISVLAGHLLGENFQHKLAALHISDCHYEEQDYYHTKLNANTLQQERAAAKFNVREMIYLLEGGKEIAEMKETMMREIERDPVFRTNDFYDLDRDALRERVMEKMRRALQYYQQDRDNQAAIMLRAQLLGMLDPSLDIRLGVHYFLFKPCIEGSGTAEQVEKYAFDMLTCRILGCFAMTELGHGSYIQGFETTATYDRTTQEFVINTPTLTATKWWIGGAAETATHCVCFARLIIDDKDYGVHIFIVQLRRLDDHTLMPGINIGDCGKKMGRNGLDNGWIQFTNVRIPRENMLMKYAKVEPDGTYVKPPLAQLAYGALIGARVQIAKGSANVLKQALTIAIRYSAVRRQFSTEEGKPEIPILDYATHQNRLMPLLAGTYAIHFTGMKLMELFMETLNKKQLDREEIAKLKDTHSTSAGLKAFCTWFAHYGLDECRQCLGGHGYSSYAGISQIFSDYAVMCTWEGDNTVMAQQTARYLIKSLRRFLSGKLKFGPSVQYLVNLPTLLGSTAPLNSEDDLLDPQKQREIYSYLAVKLLTDTAAHLQARINSDGIPERIAWNETTVELVKCAEAHCYNYMISCFIDAVHKVEQSDLRAVLKSLCDLFFLFNVQKNLATFLESGYFTGVHSHWVRAKVRALNKVIRSQAVPLVDSFDLSDFFIRSPLGRYDGNSLRFDCCEVSFIYLTASCERVHCGNVSRCQGMSTKNTFVLCVRHPTHNDELHIGTRSSNR